MKLNCDLGESFGNWAMGCDVQVMPHIDQANIACGFHAGDPLVIKKTLILAKKYDVQIGAHPSYPDLVGFGRRSMNCSEEEIIALMLYQISAIDGMAKSIGLTVDYVKPHGALYNDMMVNSNVRVAILKAVDQFNSSKNHHNQHLKLMMQATTEIKRHKAQANKFNIEILSEAFADRRYNDDGTLLSRGEVGAVLCQEEMLDQVKQLTQTRTVTTINGKTLKLDVDSLCVHGDNSEAVKAIGKIKKILTNA